MGLTEVNVEEGDSVDLDVEVRSGTLLGLVEVTVGNDLGVGGEVGVGVDVGHVAVKLRAVLGEGIGVEDVESAGLELSLGGLDSLNGAGGGNVSVDVGKNDGAGSDGACPVGVDGLAVLDLADHVLEVGAPVDAAGDDEGVGGLLDGAAVVGDVGDVVGLAGGRSAHGVGVLADKKA